MSEMKKHHIVTKDHRGNEVVLKKPVNESAMSEQEKEEWQKQKNEYLSKKSEEAHHA